MILGGQLQQRLAKDAIGEQLRVISTQGVSSNTDTTAVVPDHLVQWTPTSAPHASAHRMCRNAPERSDALRRRVRGERTCAK